MADNFAFTEGSGKTGAADDIGGVLYPRVKVTWGPDATANDADTASGKALPVQLRESDGTDVAIGGKLGALAEAAPATDTASSGLNGRLQRIAQRLTTLISSTIAISAASLPLPSGAATETTLGTRLSESDFDTKTGSLTEAAPATDTASSGLNGRLQRIAQRLTSLIALLPTSLGANGGLKIEGVASGTVVPVSLASVPSHAVTNAGTFAVQATEGDGANTTLGAKGDAKSSASDTTAITIMQVLKQISFSIQAAAASLAGTLTVASHAVTNAGTFAVQATLQAGTALIGIVSSSNETSTIYNGSTALTPKFATIVASSSGATTIVAAVTSKKIRVVALKLIANAAVNAKWQSHVTPTDKTGLSYLAANGGEVLPYNPVGWFETVSGEALDINLSGAVAVGGHLTYIEV
jgi:hypothetical protein